MFYGSFKRAVEIDKQLNEILEHIDKLKRYAEQFKDKYNTVYLKNPQASYSVLLTDDSDIIQKLIKNAIERLRYKQKKLQHEFENL